VASIGAAMLWRSAVLHRQIMRLHYDFLYALSHELRTPLTSMRQLTENLVSGRIPNEERRHRYYEVLQRDSETLVQLVERMLDFGRAEAGVLQYRFEILDIGDLLTRVIDDFRAKHTEHTVESTVDLTGIHVRADRDAIARSVWNLLDNAAKYSPECPTIWISGRRDGANVIVEVRDKGVGIKREDQTRIFNFFVRAGASGKGAGLGLAIVDILIQAHGGRITVDSSPGKGSTFRLTLPVAEA
jgi:signal transduction histidine kinase